MLYMLAFLLGIAFLAGMVDGNADTCLHLADLFHAIDPHRRTNRTHVYFRPAADHEPLFVGIVRRLGSRGDLAADRTVLAAGIANAVGAYIGFGDLLVAHLLTTAVPSFKGDSFTVLQAVLDTQFWLATHVTCVTAGYSATFLAASALSNTNSLVRIASRYLLIQPFVFVFWWE